MATQEPPEELTRVLGSPDYQRLQEMINKHLTQLANMDEDEMTAYYAKLLSRSVDVEALAFFSVTRASTVSPTNPTLMELLSSMWLEGFLIGALYKGEPQDD